ICKPKGSGYVFGEGFDLLNVIRIAVDIAIVWFVVYKLMMVIRGTKAIQLLNGIIVIVFVWALSIVFNLQTIQWIRNQAFLWWFLSIIIIFKTENRIAIVKLVRRSSLYCNL